MCKAFYALQVRGALRELRDSFTQLLRSRRAGVLAALLAAAGRAGNAALQVDAAKALLTATAGLQTGTAEQVRVHFWQLTERGFGIFTLLWLLRQHQPEHSLRCITECTPVLGYSCPT